MRIQLTKILLLLFPTITVIAQTGNETIAKGDNIIIIDTSTGADSSFTVCSKYLVQKGYTFESRDQSIGQIVTNQKSYAGAFNYKLNIVCIDNQIRIRAHIQLMTLGQQFVWTDWYYAKAKSNLMNEAYTKFYPDVAEMKSKLKNASLSFKKE